MREWKLNSDDPVTLIVAADARLIETDYCNDHIWKLSIGRGEPSALAIQTTYGLRARTMRIFPRFIEGDQIKIDPLKFINPPVIKQFFPNYVSLLYSPFPDIDVFSEYWVPDSNGLLGRIKISNSSDQIRELHIELIALLLPTEGQPMMSVNIQAAPVLAGKTGNLSPIVFLTGGPQPGKGSYPSLSLPITLDPGNSEQFVWTHAALDDTDSSFSKAREYATMNWDAEHARVVMMNSGLVEIYTGDPDWDIALALSQKQALGVLSSPTEHLKNPSFVISRQPDQGYSPCGDGSDYNHQWNGQTPIETFYLAGLILPTEPKIAKGLLRNFLAQQKEDGFIDWKPGLGGQRSGLLATPILASLAWLIYEHTEDEVFLEEVFPPLHKFVLAWLSPSKDYDSDGIPEWDHPLQIGAENHPTYSRWQEGALGANIHTSESPSLCVFLYRECQLLIRMAKILGYSGLIASLTTHAGQLKSHINSFWKPEKGFYLDWDRDTHLNPKSELITQFRGPGVIPINRTFDQPVRFLVRVQTGQDSTCSPDIYFHGVSATGKDRVEHLTGEDFKWYLGRGSLTGDRVYTSLERIEIQNIEPDDLIEIFILGYDCLYQTGLLPLWASAADQSKADVLIKNTICDPKLFWQPYGMPACADPPPSADESVCNSVNIPWNSMIGTGLLKYGYRETAAELVTRLMTGIIKTLKEEKVFRRSYHSQSGNGIGEQNALNGLAPVRLFLETLGVKVISQQRVGLSGFNPFPWPVTVKYRGLTILRQMEKSVVIFPDGQTINVDSPEPQIISLEQK
jgi:hypothetical protein